MADWTDELKAEVISSYKAANPTPENTTEIVKSIAENLGDDFTPNGVRAILVKAGEYMKKAPATATKGNGSTSTRVNKTDAINDLVSTIEASGLEADADIIGKLTGKAAIYFTNIIKQTATEQD